jgi:hypothetical protein
MHLAVRWRISLASAHHFSSIYFGNKKIWAIFTNMKEEIVQQIQALEEKHGVKVLAIAHLCRRVCF